MELDVKSINLPNGWLVKRAGFNDKRANTGIFYSGRKIMVGRADCDE